MDEVLVIGGSGFVGSRTADSLTELVLATILIKIFHHG